MKAKKKKNNRKRKIIEKIKKMKINKKVIIGILSWTLEISAIIIAIISLKIDIKVKADTAELTKFSEKPIYYKIRLWCKPEDKFTVKRFVLRTIKLDLDKNEIEIPYMQVDVHNK